MPTKTKKVYAPTFMAFLSRLTAFRQSAGRLPKRNGTDENEEQLAQWLHNMRLYARAGRLPADLAKALTNAGLFEQPYEFNLKDRVADLEAHRVAGTLGSLHGSDVNLYQWLRAQVARFEAGDLPEATEIALRGAGFDFSEVRHRVSDMPWETQLARFRTAAAINGPADKHLFRNCPSLVPWVLLQRKERHTMPVSRREELDAVGFVWEARDSTRSPARTIACKKQRAVPSPMVAWQGRLRQMREFIALHGHADVPRGYGLNPSLHTWLEQAKETASDLPPERVAELHQLGIMQEASRSMSR